MWDDTGWWRVECEELCWGEGGHTGRRKQGGDCQWDCRRHRCTRASRRHEWDVEGGEGDLGRRAGRAGGPWRRGGWGA